MRSHTSTAYGVYYYRILSTKIKTSKATSSTTPESNKKNTPPNILLASQFTPEKCWELPRLSPGNQLWIWVVTFQGNQPGGYNSQQDINSQQPTAKVSIMALQPRGYQLECLQKIKEGNTIISLPTGGPDPEDLTTLRSPGFVQRGEV